MSTQIEAVKSDILKLKNVDAIVDPTNPHMAARGGLDKQIHLAAGKELDQECLQIGGCIPGEAVVTGAYNLPYKAIIHTVGPVWKGGTRDESVEIYNSYISCLKAAEAQGIRRIAFPSIATGTYRYPMTEAAELGTEAVAAYCKEHPYAFDYICWSLVREDYRRIYERAIQRQQKADEKAADISSAWTKPVAMALGDPDEKLPVVYRSTVLADGFHPEQLMLTDGQNIPPLDDGATEVIAVFSDGTEETIKADKVDYLLAAASGMLTGAMSVLWSPDLNLEKAHEWGSAELDQVVIKAAKLAKFKPAEGKDDLLHAIKFLENNFPMAGDSLINEFGGGKQHHLRDFTHHASIVGLFFSILSQFTGVGYGTDNDGNFITPRLDVQYTGVDIPDKIFKGTVIWALHLVSDMAGSSSNPGAGTGIPGPVLSLLKDLSRCPLFHDIHGEYKEKDITFSTWVSKLFNGTYFQDSAGKPLRFDLRSEIGIGNQMTRKMLPVIVNECIVRAFCFLRKLYRELRINRIHEFADLERLLPQNLLPKKDRELTRMLSVSSGVFVIVNASGTTIKAALRNSGNAAGIAKDVALNINYAGIVRFTIAFKADWSYIREDVREAYAEYEKVREEKQRRAREQIYADYKFLTLNAEQTKILYSLEDHLVYCDVWNTPKLSVKNDKKQWMGEWEGSIASSLSLAPDDFFIRDKRQLYNAIKEEVRKSADQSWLNLLSLELALFAPYTPLGSDQDKIYRKLSTEDDYYIREVFSKNQNYVSEDTIKKMVKLVAQYKNKLTGKTGKIVVGAAGAVVASVATGGFALAFAPEIATLIAGSAVAGLSGAALTSASLAFVGGGALAAGGLGMAGGTAILTGGGALIGLLSSGAVTASNALAELPEEYVLLECCKLLTICNIMLESPYSSFALNAAHFLTQMDNLGKSLSDDIELVSRQTEKGKDEQIKKMKAAKKYFEGTSKELRKLIEL